MSSDLNEGDKVTVYDALGKCYEGAVIGSGPIGLFILHSGKVKLLPWASVVVVEKEGA